ncbi:MAG TPA: 3'-5' exonuclease, partial [Chthonomonadaceae bacterium]|nr:3'-5' exonuclease [Chthonomonadaceae bacterium]
KLEQNYRSTRTILDAAYGVISNNLGRKEKRLWTENDPGSHIVKGEALNEQEEAIWVVDKIRELIKAGGRAWSDFAVLYRTNAQSRALEDVFVNWKAPYKIVGGVRFYERKEVKDVLSYLRVVNNPMDSVSIRRIINVPPRGIGASTLAALDEATAATGRILWDCLQMVESIPHVSSRAREKLREFAGVIAKLRHDSLQLSVTDLTRRVLEQTGYLKMLQDEATIESQSRLENVKEMVSKAQQFDQEHEEEASLAAFLEDVALVADIDSLDADANAVTLMTLHSAKGLEFPVVFLVGLEECVFPHIRSMESDREIEEERRLCYVGITRAKEELYVSHANRRTTFGSMAYNVPSRFLREIPGELYRGGGRTRRTVSGFDPDEYDSPQRRRVPAGAKLWDSGPAPPPRAEHESGFRVGQKVRHEKFGVGVVLNVDGEGDKTQIEVAFPNVGPKRLLLSYARLERVK